MNVTMALFVLAVAAFGSAFCEVFDLPAYEYMRRFKERLSLGQCANRIVQYPFGIVTENCKLPNRTGDRVSREKEVETRSIYSLHSANELFRYIGLCDDRAATYFGLLAGTDDCIVNEVASKLAFKKKVATLMLMDHFRPRLDILLPPAGIDNVPKEYSHYLNNSYYTINISIGSEEVIVVELQYSSREAVDRVYAETSPTTSLSRKLVAVAKEVGFPKRVKVIRLSSFYNNMSTEVFKGKNALPEAISKILRHEQDISRIRHQLQHGGSTHLHYGFKAYEVGIVPYSVTSPLMSTKMERRRRWEDAALLQVQAERLYASHRRYKKLCRNAKTQDQPCSRILKLLNDLKRKVANIHDQRRNWALLTIEEQAMFTNQEMLALKRITKEAKTLVKKVKVTEKKKSQN